MRASERSGDAPPLLLIEGDGDLQALFTEALTDEGYRVSFASSLEQAFRLAEEQSFALILADLFISRSTAPDLERIRALRSRMYPIPLILLTRLPLSTPANLEDFAFVLPMPFDLEECLSLIALTINTPLTAEQQRQAQTFHHLLEAIEAGDWQSMADLHTEDVICVPPAHSRGGLAARWFQGKAAFRVWAEGLFRRYQTLQVSDVVLAATPRGLAARYTMRWQAPEGLMQRAGTLFLRFKGELICQVGIRITLPPLPSESAAAPLPS